MTMDTMVTQRDAEKNIKNVHMLLVEDDDVDAEAVTRAFTKARIANPFTRVHNGIEALKVLRGEDGYAKMPRPYMILLDLNMPQMNGIEFLQTLRQDPKLKNSVVFVLTTSNRDEDKVAAYDTQVAGYLLKDRAGADFFHLIEMLDAYWRIVEFPPVEAYDD